MRMTVAVSSIKRLNLNGSKGYGNVHSTPNKMLHMPFYRSTNMNSCIIVKKVVKNSCKESCLYMTKAFYFTLDIKIMLLIIDAMVLLICSFPITLLLVRLSIIRSQLFF